MKSNKIYTLASPSICIKSSFVLILFFWIILLCSNFGFILGSSVKSCYVVISAGISILLLMTLFAGKLHSFFSIVVSVALFSLATYVSCISIDYTWDGWAYHEPATIFIAQGWNPISIFQLKEMVFTINSQYGQQYGVYTNDIWVEAYPKAAWILAGVFLKSNIPIDGTKMFGFVLSFVLIALVFNYTRLLNLSRAYSLVFSVLFTLSPVVVSQLTTFYVDGLMALLMGVVLFGYLNFTQTNENVYVYFVATAGSILAALKFTGLIYLLFLALPMIYHLYISKSKCFFYSFVIISIASLGLLTWSPYLTNFINHGYVFYPFNIIDVMDGQMSKEFLGHNRFSKFFISMLSGNHAGIKSPIAFTGYTWDDFSRLGSEQDQHLNAFGPAFIIVLVLCLFKFIKIKHVTLRRPVLFALLVTILSVVFNPEMWWARYVPQLWFVPFFIVLLFVQKNRYSLISSLMLSLLFFTVTFSVYNRIVVSVKNHHDYLNVVNEIQNSYVYVDNSTPMVLNFLPAFLWRLNESGSKLFLSNKPCNKVYHFYYIQLCPAR